MSRQRGATADPLHYRPIAMLPVIIIISVSSPFTRRPYTGSLPRHRWMCLAHFICAYYECHLTAPLWLARPLFQRSPFLDRCIFWVVYRQPCIHGWYVPLILNSALYRRSVYSTSTVECGNRCGIKVRDARMENQYKKPVRYIWI